MASGAKSGVRVAHCAPYKIKGLRCFCNPFYLWLFFNPRPVPSDQFKSSHPSKARGLLNPSIKSYPVSGLDGSLFGNGNGTQPAVKKNLIFNDAKWDFYGIKVDCNFLFLKSPPTTNDTRKQEQRFTRDYSGPEGCPF
jgi:hypothetical protein